LLLISYVAVAVAALVCVIGAACLVVCFWGAAEKLLTRRKRGAQLAA
jgi:hypothetical protein